MPEVVDLPLSLSLANKLLERTAEWTNHWSALPPILIHDPSSSTGCHWKGGQTTVPTLPQQPALLENCQLKDFQLIGTSFLLDRRKRGYGCILADEMGAGKTVQTIAFLAQLKEDMLKKSSSSSSSYSSSSPTYLNALVVCPLSMLNAWQSEIDRFCPSLSTITLIGDRSAREKIKDTINKQSGSDVFITSYEMVMIESEFFSKFEYSTLIIDEAHRLKNSSSALYITLRQSITSGPCVLLTGTPSQNNLNELYSLLAFVAPTNFTGKWNERFIQAFSPIRSAIATGSSLSTNSSSIPSSPPSSTSSTSISTTTTPLSSSYYLSSLTQCLRLLLLPFLLRRTKQQVGLSLPPKHETVVLCGLTRMQLMFFKNIITRNAKALLSLTQTSNSTSPATNTSNATTTNSLMSDADNASASYRGPSVSLLNNVLASLRKCVNHPYLFPNAEPEPFEEGDHLWQNSHKLALLEHLLPVLYSRGRRVLLFSTSTSTLDILQDYLNYRGYSYERLDGSVRGDERFQSIERFQGQHTKVATKDSHDEKELSSTLRNRKVANDGESTIPFVFLLSTRAGGQGITLTKANTVIFYDSDPNPMMDLQAESRCHRIGQTDPVMIFRLITLNTFEELFYKKSKIKTGLATHILADDDVKKGYHHSDMATTTSNSSGDGMVINPKSLGDAVLFGADKVWQGGEAQEWKEEDAEKLVRQAEAILETLKSDSRSNITTLTHAITDTNDINSPSITPPSPGKPSVDLEDSITSTCPRMSPNTISSSSSSGGGNRNDRTPEPVNLLAPSERDLELSSTRYYGGINIKMVDKDKLTSKLITSGKRKRNEDHDEKNTDVYGDVYVDSNDDDGEVGIERGKGFLREQFASLMRVDGGDSRGGDSDGESAPQKKRRRVSGGGGDEDGDTETRRLERERQAEERREARRQREKEKEEAAKSKKLAKWKELGYVSAALPEVEEEVHGEDMGEGAEDESEEGKGRLYEGEGDTISGISGQGDDGLTHYVRGDASHPVLTLGWGSCLGTGVVAPNSPLSSPSPSASPLPFSSSSSSSSSSSMSLSPFPPPHLTDDLSASDQSLLKASYCFQSSRGFIILNAIDDSGAISSGRYLQSLSLLHSNVKAQYELAGTVDDLDLGSAHLIPFQVPTNEYYLSLNSYPKDSRNENMNDSSLSPATLQKHTVSPPIPPLAYVCHLVVMHRKTSGRITPIDPLLLTESVKKVAQYASEHGLCVVSPRIADVRKSQTPILSSGNNTRSSSSTSSTGNNSRSGNMKGGNSGGGSSMWYACERVLTKYFGAKRVPLFIFYYAKTTPFYIRFPSLFTPPSRSMSSMLPTISPPTTTSSVPSLPPSVSTQSASSSLSSIRDHGRTLSLSKGDTITSTKMTKEVTTTAVDTSIDGEGVKAAERKHPGNEGDGSDTNVNNLLRAPSSWGNAYSAGMRKRITQRQTNHEMQIDGDRKFEHEGTEEESETSDALIDEGTDVRVLSLIPSHDSHDQSASISSSSLTSAPSSSSTLSLSQEHLIFEGWSFGLPHLLTKNKKHPLFRTLRSAIIGCGGELTDFPIDDEDDIAVNDDRKEGARSDDHGKNVNNVFQRTPRPLTDLASPHETCVAVCHRPGDDQVVYVKASYLQDSLAHGRALDVHVYKW